MSITAEKLAELFGVQTDIFHSEIDFSKANEVHQNVEHNYNLVSEGEISQGQALYNILRHAESINGGDYEAALVQVALSVVGDDVINNGGGPWFVDGRTEFNVTGADGFMFEFGYEQEHSNQISHAIAGLVIAQNNGSVGTLGAILFEYQHAGFVDVDQADVALYIEANLVIGIMSDPDRLQRLVENGVIADASLSEVVRWRVLDGSVDPFAFFELHEVNSLQHNKSFLGEAGQYDPPEVGLTAGGLLINLDDGTPVLGQLGRTNLEHSRAWEAYDNFRTWLGLSPSDGNESGREFVSREEQGERNAEALKKAWQSVKDFFSGGAEDVDDAQPIILDLDGDGIQITELSQSHVFIDANNDGLENRMAWAAAGNGVLFYDADGDGVISETREFVFTEWDPTAKSDLEAIASVFDSNGDGVLDASDAAFADFKVMVTNADGTFSVLTLTELDITSINLTGDATHIELPDGSVITGQTEFTWADGSTGIAGDVELSYDAESHRVERVSTTDANGNLVVSSTGYATDGSVAFKYVSVTSPDGSLIENSYDDNGDGVVDRLQVISTTSVGTVETKTVSNSAGSDLATAFLVNRTVTVTDGDTITISRDSTGGGWFDQVEVQVTHADGSRTITVEDVAYDGSVIQSSVETVSADGLTRTEVIDRDGDGATDLTITHVIVVNADGSRTETTSSYNADGTLRSTVVETTSADGKTRTIARDADGDGHFEVTEDSTIAVNGDGSTTSTIVVENEDGSTRGSTTQTQSDDALTKTVAVDLDGDGTVDRTTVDETVLHADGSRDRTITVTNGDGSIHSMIQETLGADQVSYELWNDLNRNGVFDATDLITSVTVDAATGDRTTSTWNRNVDGSFSSSSVSEASEDGLSVLTDHDIDGDGDIDRSVADITVVNGDGSTTRTVATHNQDGSLRSEIVTEASADGLTITTTVDIDGDGTADAVTVVARVLNADDSRTTTTSDYAGDGTTLLSRVTLDESADHRQVTETHDYDGDGIADLVVVSVEADDGTVTVTETGYFDDGSVSHTSVTVQSSDGLTTTTTSDADGDGINEVTVVDATVLNLDGSQTNTVTVQNGDGSLRSSSVTETSDDGMVVTSSEDSDGDGVYERVSTSATSFGADGSTTITTQTVAADGTALNGERQTVSDDGLTVTVETDTNGDGIYDLTTQTVTTLLQDGSTVEVAELFDSQGSLRSQTTTTTSDDGRVVTVERDFDGDGHIDQIETITEADDGTVTSEVTDYALDGSIESHNQTVTSDTGLGVTERVDFDGDGVFDRIVETETTNNADGSTTMVSETQGNDGSVSSITQTDISGDGRTQVTATDIDADGVADFVVTETSDVTIDGIETQTSQTHAADGSLISSYERITSADGNTVSEISDLDGNGIADEETLTTVAADGTVTSTSSYYSEGGGLEGTFTRIASGDGQFVRTELDRNGDGRIELLTEDRTVLGADGSVTRTVDYLDDHYRSLGSEHYYQSDDGLFVSVSYDLDDDGFFDFVSESTTVFEDDGDVVTAIRTHDETGDVIAEEITTQSGDGLQISTVVDYDGDGAFDRIDVTTHGPDGGYTQVIEEFGQGASLTSSATITASADGLTTLTQLDLDGDGIFDQDYQSQIEADQSVTSVYRDLSALGETESEITSTVSDNGLTSRVEFDVDGNGSVDFVRESVTEFGVDGSEITTFSETSDSGVLIYQEVHTVSADGLTETTQFDIDGDGVIDGTRTTTTTINEDGSEDQFTQTVYADGDLRAQAHVHTSADGRHVITELDYDGNGIADKIAELTVSADGEQVEVVNSFGEAGALNSTFTTITSADGLTVTTIRDSASGADTVETTTYAAAGSGSYVWDNGATASQSSAHQTASHEIDANGIDIWTFTSSYRDNQNHLITETFETQLDVAARQAILEEAARLYDTLLDRDMDSVEREELVRYIEDGQLDLGALANDLLGEQEYHTRYRHADGSGGTEQTDAEFVTQLYLNSYGRAPTMLELASHLAALSGDADPWSGIYNSITRADLAIELAQSSEHVVTGNGHMSTNNFDVIMNPAVFERFLDQAYVESIIKNMVDVAYDRDVTDQELSYLTKLLLDGTETVEDIAEKLLAISGEQFGQTTNSLHSLDGIEFINQAFLNAFGRLPEPDELGAWSDLIGQGVISKAQFLASLAQSAEHLAVGNVHELGEQASVTTHLGDTNPNDVDDNLSGSAGIDYFVGGAGDDTLKGNAGSDVYQWSKGDGNDLIDDNSDSKLETDTLLLTDVVSSDVLLERVQGTNDLLIKIVSTGEIIKIGEQYLNSGLGDGIEAIQFSDGVTWTLEDILDHTSVVGTSANDSQSGLSAFDDIFEGGNGKDVITGNDGDDLLTGGLSFDTLDGGNGDDAYVWYSGDGEDTISDSGQSLTDIDTLVLADVLADQVVLSKDPDNPNNLLVEIANPVTQNGTQGVLYFEYYETLISVDTVAEIPTSGASTGLIAAVDVNALAEEYGINAQTFAVRLFGAIEITEAGDYSFELGSDDGSKLWIDGVEVVDNDGTHAFTVENGMVYLSPGTHTIEIGYFEVTGGESLSVSVAGPDTDNELVELFESGLLGDAADADGLLNSDPATYTDFVAPPTVITISDQFAASTNGVGIEAIEFADGTIWTLNDILELTGITGTDGNDSFDGTAYGDNFYGGAGNDTLDDINVNGGDDVFHGGTGDDTLRGNDGSDTYVWSKGDGNDTIDENADSQADFDALILSDVLSSDVALTRVQGSDDLLITVLSTGEVITVSEQFQNSSVGDGIESIVFADGIVWTLPDIHDLTAVSGTASGDTLTGLSDFGENFYGLGGADTINANDGDDFIVGGAGSDLLKGGDGSDIYLWELGDGNDTIDDRGSSPDDIDVIEFSDISSTDVDLSKAGDDLVINIDGLGGIITVLDRFDEDKSANNYGVELLVFSDGVTVEVLASSVAQTIVTGTAANNKLDGWGFADYLYGLDGSDTLTGRDGDDTLEGGEGEDILRGDDGSDTYAWSAGDGNDSIDDNANSKVQTDTLVLKDVGVDGVTLTRVQGSDDLIITILATGEVITVQEQFQNSSVGDGIEAIVFADGVTWTLEDIEGNTWVNGTSASDVLGGLSAFDENFHAGAGNDTINANAGNDTLDGGEGIDIVRGGDGSDTYVWSLGDGDDILDENGDSLAEIDTLSLTDVNAGDISLTRLQGSDDLLVTILSTGEVITVREQFLNVTLGDGIEAIVFADGTIWTLDDILANTRVEGTAGNEKLTGANSFDENFYGGAGNDTLDANGGDDTLVGGTGDDTLWGDDGSDTYVWSLGDGDDSIDDNGSLAGDTDTLVLTDVMSDDVTLTQIAGTNHLQVTITSTGATITDYDAFSTTNSAFGLERIEFADGVVWRLGDEYGAITVEGTSGADTLYGLDGNDHLFGFDGNDQIHGGAGNDTLDGGAGHDQLWGGAGNDTLIAGGSELGAWDYLLGQDGDDTYLVGSDDMRTYISAAAETETSGAMDRVVFENLTLDDIRFDYFDYTYGDTVSSSEGIALRLIWIDNGQQAELSIANMGENIEEYVFADGTVLTSIEVDYLAYGRDRLKATDDDDYVATPSGSDWAYVYGLDGNDTLIGGAGRDHLFGGNGDDVLSAGGNDRDDAYQYLHGRAGNDTYLIGSGDEFVFLNHTAEFDEAGSVDQIVFTDLLLEDLTLSTFDHTQGVGNDSWGNSLNLTWATGNLRIANEGQYIETFVFADGTTLTLSEVLDLL